MSAESKTDRKLGYADYACFPDDGRRHEIIGGEHFVNPAPSTCHQTVSRRIHFQLYSQIELNGHGQVFNAPTDVLLSAHDIVQPDLVVVLSRNEQKITRLNIQGTPDFLVEILSPATETADRLLKRELYRRAGLAEYWIVDPEGRRLEQLWLDEGNYQVLGSHSERVEARVLGHVVVDLQQVW